MADSIEWGIFENGEVDDDWKVDYSEEETQEDTEDDWIQSILPKEKRNLGSPCVIEMLSDGVTSISLPEILQFEQTTRSNKETFYGIDNTLGSDTLPNEKDTSIIIAKSINLKCDTRTQSINLKCDTRTQTSNHEQQTLPALLNMNESNRNEDTKSSNKLKDIDLNDTSNSNKSIPGKQCIKNKKRKNSTICNDDAKAHSSFQNLCTLKQEYDGLSAREDISVFQQENVGTMKEKNINIPQIEIESISKSQPEGMSVYEMCDKKLPKVYCTRNMVIVIMEKESGFCFSGKLLVKVLYGAVKIYGFVLNNSIDATKVYSPRGYNHVAIETAEEFSGSIVDIWTTLAAENITRDSESELQIDIDNIQPGMAVLVLQNFENNLTLSLNTYFPHFKLFPTIKNSHYYPWTSHRRAEIILQANLYSEQHDEFKYKRLILDSFIAEDTAEKMLSRWYENKWSCTMIMGGKGVGKSTNVRYLINSLLRTTKVVLVDVDPGQAECTPASCISYSLIEEPLLGPNFTHLKTPIYQLFLDEVNIAPCVIRYLEGVKMLMERLKGCPVLSRLPIVVNTMGFVQNLGWDVAIFTIKLIRPSFILQIKSSTRHANFKENLSAKTINKQVTCNFFNDKYLCY